MEDNGKRRKIKVYISGPITGSNNYQERFKHAAEVLKADNFEPINPAKISTILPEGSTTWDEYMQVCIAAELTCDMVYFLKGWDRSAGARTEMAVAKKLRMPILFETGAEP